MAAEDKARALFDQCAELNIIQPGLRESEVSQAIFDLGGRMFGVKKYWHKRIVRAGANTLLPYAENPEDRIINEDDILFIDFGPVFEAWEADLGRTFVLGNDPHKHKITREVSRAWQLGAEYFRANLDVTGSELYRYVSGLATDLGYSYPQHHCGHLIGAFPHERIEGDDDSHYLSANNHQPLRRLGVNQEPLRWILEIHFADQERGYGAFEEALLLDTR